MKLTQACDSAFEPGFSITNHIMTTWLEILPGCSNSGHNSSMKISKSDSPSAIKSSMARTLGFSLAALLIPISAQATPLLFDQNVAPDVIFGSGNANGSFTVDRDNGVELGLRAKIPFVGTINSNGDATYSYNTGETWNFDWTINTNYDGSNPGLKLDDLSFYLSLDIDPSAAISFFTFDPVTPTGSVPYYDHSIGDNTTGNGQGTEATNSAEYTALLANNNVLQQSWRYQFFTGIPGFSYDPTLAGAYSIYLTALDSNAALIARTQIQVLVTPVPEPSTYLVLCLGLLGIVLRKKK